MSRPADQMSPTPSQGEPGSDLRSVANQIEGLLNDDGHFNPNPDQLSRGHPDYDESSDDRAQPRDERTGQFKSADEEPVEEIVDSEDADLEDQADGDDRDEDIQDTVDDTDDDQTASADPDAVTDDQETGDIQTLDELAGALELSTDDFKQALTHTFMAAGEEVTVTLAELESGYQKDADYRRQTQQLAEDRRNAELDYAARMQAYEQANVVTAQVLNATEQMFRAELEDPQLDTLRAADPAEWTARREEIGQRIQVVQQARQNAAQQMAAFQHQQKAELRQREEHMLKTRMPDFGANEVQIARQAMESIGFQGAEIDDIFDHRLVLGALELSNLRAENARLKAIEQEKEDAKDVVKRVKKEVPKITKPGKQRQKGTARVKRDSVARLKQRAAKSGNLSDAAAVIETMI